MGLLGRINIRSMRWRGGQTTVSDSDRSAARGTCQVRSRKPLQKKYVAKGADQNIGWNTLKLGGAIATLSGLSLFG